MTSRRPPSGKGKERRLPPAEHEDEFDDESDDDCSLEEQIRRPMDDRILCFIPNDGIHYDVIRTEIPSFLGPKASVSRGKHPKTGRPGYHIRAYETISINMISDLKMDTIRWSDEMRKSNNKEYKFSNTHRMRQKAGPTQETPPSSTTPSQYHQDKGEETRSILFHPTTRTSDMPPQDNSSGRVDRGQQAQSQRGYDEQMRSSNPYTRPDAQGPAPQGQDSRSQAYAHSSTAIYIQNIQQTQNPSTAVPASSAQPITRQEVERKVVQKLRDQGYKDITRSQLDRAVDNAIRSLQEEAAAREERAVSVPPPYSEHPGALGPPRPSQPSTSGTRGFDSKYPTAGPDYSRHQK